MNEIVLRSRVLSFLMFMGATGAALTVAGCGGDDSDEAAAPDAASLSAPSSSSDNRAPTISGSPNPTVLQGNAYAFTPSASDADGNTLSFSVLNLPSWATFSASSGRVSGTPTAGDVGTYGNIRISVSDGSASASLSAFSIQVVATATGSATLSWNPPTQNTDGSPLSNLAGYRVYWGPSEGHYTNSVTVDNPGLSSYVVEQLTPATWYFAVTAVNSVGLESSYSNTTKKQVM